MSAVSPDSEDAQILRATRDRDAARWLRASSWAWLGPRVAAVVIAVWACAFVPDFATSSNISTLLASFALTGIAAAGAALVTIGGNYFLLSTSAVGAVSTLLFAQASAWGVAPAILAALVGGLALGCAQGYFVACRGTDPIITTVAAASIIAGIGQVVAGGQVVAVEADVDVLATGTLGGVVPVTTIVFLVLAAALEWGVRRTRTGRELRLVGSNREAARTAGLRVPRTLLLSYVGAGAAAAIAGALYAAQGGQGSMQFDPQFTFDVIAAIVVGGIAVGGGKGHVSDAAFGALFIALISNVLLVQGFDLDMQLLVQGAVVLIVIMLAAAAGRRAR